MFKIFLMFCLFASTEAIKTKEIKLIKEWKKNKQGSQNFIIEENNEETRGIFSWNLEDNSWKFEYEKAIVEIKNEKLTRSTRNTKKEYPCVGIWSILKYNINQWESILINNYEMCDENNHCILITKHDNKSIVWEYHIDPFYLISIAFSSDEKSYLMNFEEKLFTKDIQ